MKKTILSLLTAGLICSSTSGIWLTNAEESSVKGDINSDGVFNVMDALLFQKWIIGHSDIDMNIIKTADFNNDSRVNIADFCLMKNALLSDEPVSPVSPVSAQPIVCDDIDDVKKIINASDVSAYPENYRNACSEMFGRFKDDRYFYKITENTFGDEGIKMMSERGIALMPYAEFEDNGILYHVKYKGENYQVFIYFTDPQYSGQFQTMSEYNDLRFKFKDYQEVDESTITVHIAGEESTQIISYCLMDQNHYYKVQTYASDRELTEFMNVLTFKRDILTTPLLLIEERRSDGYYYNSVINEEGNRYTAGAICVPPDDGEKWTFEDDIAYVISQGEKESFIQDTEILQKISYFSKNAAKYTDCKKTDINFGFTDGCETSLQLLYNDENGTLRFLRIYDVNDGYSSWRDNKEIQDLVRMMIQRGYIEGKDFLDTVDGNDQKTNDPCDESEIPAN